MNAMMHVQEILALSPKRLNHAVLQSTDSTTILKANDVKVSHGEVVMPTETTSCAKESA